MEFVAKVTKEGSPDFVPPAERIAVFDNDGTLWAEQPLYFQFLFAIDRVKALAPQHPEWKEKQPFKATLEGNLKTVFAGSGARFMGLVHHTDAEREWGYNRKSSIGRLDKALDEARAKGWTVVSTKMTGRRSSRNEVTDLLHSHDAAALRPAPVVVRPFDRLGAGSFGRLRVDKTWRPGEIELVQ